MIGRVFTEIKPCSILLNKNKREIKEDFTFYCKRKPRHSGGVQKSLSGEEDKKTPNMII